MGNAKSSLDRISQETRWVDLHGLKVKSLPPEILPPSHEVGMSEESKRSVQYIKNVEGLCLSMNPITLSDDLSKLTSLEFLDLSHCNLLTLHRSISALVNLKELNIQKNSISIIPTLPQSLEKFDASNNMILQLPEQFSTLPNLYFLNLEGNPCAKRSKNLVLKGRARTGRVNGKDITFEKLRFNSEEMETLGKVFEELVNPKDGLISSATFYYRMGLKNVPDTTFVDSFFRVIERYGSKDELDVRAFLLGLGVVFKGTVEEKMTFCFNLFDLDYDGIIELQDMLDVTKSALISSIHIAGNYKDEFPREEGSDPNAPREFDFSVRTNTFSKASTVVRSRLDDAKLTAETVASAHWPYLKEVTTKRFKAMDRHGKGKVNYQDFVRGNFARFADINQFLVFYGSILSYGPQLKV